MKKLLSLALACMMTFSTVSCLAETAATEELPDVEVWYTNANGYLPIEKDSTMYNFYKETIGVGVTTPYVEWNGGQTYVEQLSLRVAAGTTPDVFLVYNGIENDLITDGAVLDLTDYLQEYCPNLWNNVPSDVWDTIRANDPTGQGRIWYTPNIQNYTRHGAVINKTWLDKLGLSIPTTQEELVEVLRAFKTQDPNGNGIADEIPAGGRAEARWMDYLFQMYGVAMFEGYPEWDIYDGELTYSAVTSNMKEAVAFVASLYQEGLLDPETLLNDKAAWDGKMNSGEVGVFYHIPYFSYYYMTNIEDATGEKNEYVTLPVISAEGYDGFVTVKPFSSACLCVAATTDEAKIKACLKILDAFYSTGDLADTLRYGAEGMHFQYKEDGTKELLPDDPAIQQLLVVNPYEPDQYKELIEKEVEMVRTEDNSWAIDIALQNVETNEACGKIIAGDGMPSSVYDGYADIKNRTLYVEYISKIITGEWSIDKWDEFVDKWYANGGTEVTAAAREWYAKKSGN